MQKGAAAQTAALFVLSSGLGANGALARPLARPIARTARYVIDIAPNVDPQHIERYVAAADYGLIKIAQIILCSQRRLGPLALGVDFALAHFVAAGLPRPGTIAVNLWREFSDAGAVGLSKPPLRLASAPAHGVEARIDHQTAAAEGNALQIAQPPDRIIVIGTQFIGELLGIKRPAFRIGVERQDRADQRQAIGLFALPDVTGDALVEAKVWHGKAVVAAGFAQIEPDLARDRAID